MRSLSIDGDQLKSEKNLNSIMRYFLSWTGYSALTKILGCAIRKRYGRPTIKVLVTITTLHKLMALAHYVSSFSALSFYLVLSHPFRYYSVCVVDICEKQREIITFN